jgi:hypothetical protein
MLIEGTLMDTIDIRPYLGLERVFADCSQAESRYVQVVANLLHICVKTSSKTAPETANTQTKHHARSDIETKSCDMGVKLEMQSTKRGSLFSRSVRHPKDFEGFTSRFAPS